MPRLSVWSVALVAVLMLVAALPLPFVAAQPPEAPPSLPSPLELARGLREQGMADLALEYLREIENKPLPPDEKAAIALERAKCQLEAADDEPDEGARAGLVAEAKESFAAFLKANPDHPRAAEAYLALARLNSLDAKAALARARRAEDTDQEKAEAARARPLFQKASELFKQAAEKIDTQLKQPNLDANVRRILDQEKVEAELARGVNQFATADTYINPNAKETKERSDLIDDARRIFAALANGPVNDRTSWVARAWVAECLLEQGKPNEAQEEFNKVTTATSPFADDGKRTVQFFQLRRRYLDALRSGVQTDLQAAEQLTRRWLTQYGTNRRARSEATAARFYLAVNLQRQGNGLSTVTKDNPPKVTVPPAARARFQEAERLFRAISQTDNEYSHRAGRFRMQVVRMLLGEADRPPTDYRTFEECQMAALIQTAKLIDLQKAPQGKDEEIKARKLAIVALLERARELATEKDNPADVTDVLIRLIYYYEETGQPYQAAVLGEYVATTLKVPGGKAPVAGTLAVTGYTAATGQLKIVEVDKLDAARRADRDRAIRLARFLDEKFPNDSATDGARHRLGVLLYQDGKPVEAFDVLVKVRAGYPQVANARLFLGGIASQLLTTKDSPLPPDRRREVFHRTVADLDKTVRPGPGADLVEVRNYVSVRCRLALLYLLQLRVDPEADAKAPGYAKAQQVAQEVLGLIPTFTCLAGEEKQLNLDDWEMKLLAEDARARAVYLRGQAAYTQGKYDDVFNALGEVLAEMQKDPTRFVEQVRKATSTPAPPEKKDEKGDEKKDGKKDEKKEEKKDPPEMMEDEPGGALKARVVSLAATADRLHQDLIVLGLKARVKQGQVDRASELIDLLKKSGGSLEANATTLQQLSAELAAHIVALRRDGKADEAKALTDGFAKLLDKVSAEPNLPPVMQLFMGQALIVVGEPVKAVAALKKVPAPKEMAWLTLPASKLPDDDARRQVAEYRRATLELIRAHRLAKQYIEADNLLKMALGDQAKPGWAYTSIDFRKEVAYLFEARGADDPQNARQLWGLALKEWNELYAITRNRVERDLKDPPKDANGNVDNLTIQRNKNMFFEAYFDVQRCILKANNQLLKTNPMRLQESLDKTAKAFVDQEKANWDDMVPDVRMKYHDLLEEHPDLKKAYQAAGGKQFLQRQ